MISRVPVLRVALSLVSLHLIAGTPAFAQNTEDQNAFDFSLPGARSRAIGGAFVAIADDATSVYSNPAGLTLLFRPEVSVEGRYWNPKSSVLDRGHGFGPATGIGVDMIDGFVEKDFESNVTGLSFLSFVYPSENWAVGVFRHQLARYRMDRRIEGPFFDCDGGSRGLNGTPPFCESHALADGVDREFPKLQSFELNIHSFGTAFAYDWSEKLSTGVAVQFFSFSIDATNKVFTARGEQKYQPPNFADPENLEVISTQTGDDHALAVNLGALWNVSPRWVVGASFRQGPQFEFSTNTVSGPKTGNTPIIAQPDNPFRVPDTFSVGVLHRLTDFWRVSFEYDRINFHQLIDDLRNTSLFAGDPEAELVAERLRLDNANQLRVGAERLVLVAGSRVLAFRGGLWYDPNHLAYFDGDEATGLPAPRWAVLLPKRDGTLHVSGGAGFTARRHFQIDVAVDFSELVNTLAVSSVWRF
jgi:long-subunit fatty acid transport protein